MQKINLRDLYPDVYKTDAFLEVTDEVQAVFQADERAEAAYERKMYRYKAQYSLDCENGIENAVLRKPETPEMGSRSKKWMFLPGICASRTRKQPAESAARPVPMK